MKNLILLLTLAVTLASCADKEAPVNVQQLNQQFIGAWNNRNATVLDSLLADDVSFVQGEIHFNGKAEVSEKWVDETLGTIADLKTNVVSSGTDSEIAYEAGTFSVDVLPSGPGEPAGEGEGNFMLLWKKQKNGAWKLSYAQLEDLPVEVKNN